MSIQATKKDQQLHVCITGSSAGIGLAAAKRLIAEGHVVYHACRSTERANHAVQEAGGGIPLVCNLADLDSVADFCQKFPEKKEMDVLCLNAGVAPSTKASKPRLTNQGFEECIGINHIGHFLLANLLFQSGKLPPRVVVTSSSVHDPSLKAGQSGGKGADLGDLSGLGSTFGDHIDNAATMVDGSKEYHGGKVYKDSKLCNILFVREALKRFSGNQHYFLSFNPGFVPTTGLFNSLRQTSPLTAWVLTTVAYWAGWSVPVEVAGDRLHHLITAPSSSIPNGSYLTAPTGSRATCSPGFDPQPVSTDGANDDLAARLWQRSLDVVRKWLQA